MSSIAFTLGAPLTVPLQVVLVERIGPLIQTWNSRWKYRPVKEVSYTIYADRGSGCFLPKSIKARLVGPQHS